MSWGTVRCHMSWKSESRPDSNSMVERPAVEPATNSVTVPLSTPDSSDLLRYLASDVDEVTVPLGLNIDPFANHHV